MRTVIDETTLGDGFAHSGIPDFEYARTDLQVCFEYMDSLLLELSVGWYTVVYILDVYRE